VPEPTGPYPVGRVSYDWVDSARTEIYAANPEDRRELVVFVWYPAKPRLVAEFAPYLPARPCGRALTRDPRGCGGG
jgi:hypothetical protein